MSGLGFIAKEPNGMCELCGKKDELRPYGLNNERICVECGIKNEKITEKKMKEYLFGSKHYGS